MMKRFMALVTLMVTLGMAGMPMHGQLQDTEMNKKNLGKLLALYPKPVTVIGAEVDGKVNWLTVGHTGIIGVERVLVSMGQGHYTNHGIRKTRRLSINLVSREMLPQADYVGQVSGATTDKSQVFKYHMGEYGTPVIDDAPLTMECNVDEILQMNNADNFICSIVNTYAAPELLDGNGQLDYTKLKPVIYEGATSLYLATGEVIGRCVNLDKLPRMCAKQEMAQDGFVRLSRVKVRAKYLEEYLRCAREVGETSLRTEPGVLTMYAVSDRKNPCLVTILETYASKEAYESHIASEHFRKYKEGTARMVKSLELADQMPVSPANCITNFIK